ncbi:protocatechuate 3,4-dioxygenase [Caenimonas sedimenti]|uniref:Protocatechuate 3,4-dioxygenase n=1 Tax=Caenimonas sedimenti TaxID=2596921 RepID=A0A562ZVR7_9BURK|nr:class III extradiol dioxygenase family protein [Caenimonas sedimenti]TWO72709.1 protocatechuate 3,4-dioxygenase [Caenimonas sedimenti]
MATIVGTLLTSHVPAIGGAIARGLQDTPYWKPFFDGFRPVHEWLAQVRPDIAIVFYNDHGLNFFLDKMPTFAVGAAAAYHHADEGWGLPTSPPVAGDAALSWHVIEALVAAEFDPVTCQEMLIDHAVTVPLSLFWPGPSWPVKIVPICINTVQFPLPSASRCWKLGRSVGRAVRAWPGAQKVVVIGSGGLSHQLDGERAGFINKPFDLAFMRSLVEQPEWATRFNTRELVAQAGTQGVELLMWLAARAALPAGARQVAANYHIPISNTAAGMMLLAPEPEAEWAV